MQTITESVTPSDLALGKNALLQEQIAASTLQFVQAHLAKVYQLGPSDSLDMTSGIITRIVPDEPQAAEEDHGG